MLIEHLEILDREPSSDVQLFYNSSLFIPNTILDAQKLEYVECVYGGKWGYAGNI